MPPSCSGRKRYCWTWGSGFDTWAEIQCRMCFSTCNFPVAARSLDLYRFQGDKLMLLYYYTIMTLLSNPLEKLGVMLCLKNHQIIVLLLQRMVVCGLRPRGDARVALRVWTAQRVRCVALRRLRRACATCPCLQVQFEWGFARAIVLGERMEE